VQVIQIKLSSFTLKITKQEEPELTKLKLEGRFAGPYINELDRNVAVAGSFPWVEEALCGSMRRVVHRRSRKAAPSRDPQQVRRQLRGKPGAYKIFCSRSKKQWSSKPKAKRVNMRGPYGFDFNESCQSCKARVGRFFCQLPSAALRDFDAMKSLSAYPAGAVLFLEEQDPRGVFLLCEGQVKLSVNSSEGKTLILRIAKPGEILGLMPTLTGNPYEVTAEALHPCQVAFIRRGDFMRFVGKHPQTYQNVVRELSSYYRVACEQLRTLGLSASAPEKLAKLLLNWSAGEKETKQGTQIKFPLTHQEIANFIGTTRETVTRTLSEFRSRRLVAFQGSTLMIPSRAALESFVSV
jgi:CRP/FNR family cyclic AMP-dependent transcriptional regulator